MEEKKLFKIGEVAGIYHISMGTLRHYEREGLLEPEMVDPQTGYRYYSAKQFEVLNTIRYLRVLDMPLSQIADFLKNRDVDVIKEKLIQQKKLIRQKQQELEQISRKIDHRLEYLQDAVNSRLDEIMEKEIPDLLLLDIHMHGMNGYEVMEWMNTHLAAAQIPVILLTADTDRESEEQGRALGAIGFIKKPFEPGRLLECVNRILNTEA